MTKEEEEEEEEEDEEEEVEEVEEEEEEEEEVDPTGLFECLEALTCLWDCYLPLIAKKTIQLENSSSVTSSTTKPIFGKWVL